MCDGSRDCPDGEDEVQCETAEEEEKEKKKVTLVSIHTKVAKKAKARLELEEAKVVLIDGRKAKVKRRRRLRKVDKETESDDKGKENEITEAENEFERRDGLQTKVRKKPRTETEAKKQLTGDEIKIEESNLVEIENGTKTTEIPVIPTDSLTTVSTKFTSEIEEAMKEGITEFPTATEPVGFERKDGGRVLLVGERKVRVKKRRRQKSPTPKSLLNLPSSSDSDASSGSAPVSSSSQLYSVEQLRQFLGQTTDNRQAADKRNEGEDPPMILDKSPSIPAKSFQGTWIFNSFEKPNSRPTLPEPNLPNPPLPGPALPPGFFASFDAQFV